MTSTTPRLDIINAGDRRFRDLFAAAPVALAYLREDQIEIVNQRFLELFGYSQQELISLEDWWPRAYPDPAYRCQVQASWETAVRQAAAMDGIVEPHEYRVTCKNGEERILLIGGRLLPDGFLVTFIDLTADRRLQEQLRLSQERLSLAMEASNDGIWDWNLITNQTYYSPAYFTMLGYVPEDFTAATSSAYWVDLLHPDERARTLEQAKRLLADPGHYELEFRLRTKEGGYKWILSRGKVMARDATGRASRAVGTHTDLTARKGLEFALRAANAEQEAILETATSGIALIKDRLLRRCNRRLHEMFGWPLGEMVGKPTSIWYPDEEANRIGGEPYAAIWHGEAHRREQELVRRDGSRFWARLTGKAVDVRDQAKGTVWIIDDISVERAAIEEMRRARDLAEEATRLKSDFLANMSHEIRTPMNAILGMLYLALKADLPSAARHHLLKAQGAAHTLLGLINDILDFSKIEAGRIELEEVEFSLDSITEHLIDTIGQQGDHKGLEFLVRYDANIPPTLLGDPLRIGQVLLNLCGNAIKFTPAGEVELAFRCLEASEKELIVQIRVRDTGIGMSAEVQERIFQKFSQADQSTTRRFGGTGLGLAISRSLVELMGGRIWVEASHPGEGTTFCLTLPLRIAPQAQSQRGALATEAGPLLASVRVLIVDDNQASREILAEMLERLHVSIGRATCGAEALHQLRTARPPYDLVLMDWRMPGMNGDEAAQRIQADPAILPKPKVVMVTAYGREDVFRLAELAGVKDFLIKPVSPSLLLDTLVTMLGRGHLFADQEPPGADLTRGTRSGNLTGARILLVEDNDINREFATELLLSEGMRVEEATNGLEALAKVQQGDFDAILMDIQMPVMDGLEATRRIRALASAAGGEPFARLPIIAMTALAMVGDAEKCLSAGMNDHVTKPVNPELLMAVLGRWVHLAPEQERPAATLAPEADTREASALLDHLGSLDSRGGIHRIGGKVEAYLRQLQRFRARYPDAAEELKRRLALEGVESAEGYCHALRGVAGNLGAQALYQQLCAIDDRLKRGEIPDDAALARLRHPLGEVMADIDRLSLTQRPISSHAAPLEAGRLAELLESLNLALASDLGAVESLLERLRAGVEGTALEPQIEAIAAQVELFAIDEARQSLSVLRGMVHD